MLILQFHACLNKNWCHVQAQNNESFAYHLVSTHMFLKYLSRYKTDALYCMHLLFTILPMIKDVWGEKSKKETKQQETNQSTNQNSTKVSGEMDFFFWTRCNRQVTNTPLVKRATPLKWLSQIESSCFVLSPAATVSHSITCTTSAWGNLYSSLRTDRICRQNAQHWPHYNSVFIWDLDAETWPSMWPKLLSCWQLAVSNCPKLDNQRLVMSDNIKVPLFNFYFLWVLFILYIHTLKFFDCTSENVRIN